MKFKQEMAAILIVFCATTLVPAGTTVAHRVQINEENLAQKYKTFLSQTQLMMTSQEKKTFLNLKSDQERDGFIRRFWQQRGRRQPAVRANVALLMLMRMAQALDLTEEQIAKILPVMNQKEREKQLLQDELLKKMRELRVLVENASADEQSLEEMVGTIRDLEGQLREKEVEFNTVIEASLSPLQKAKYILFAQDFYRELRDTLNDARRVQLRLQELRKRR
jgi:hypothetical protein